MMGWVKSQGHGEMSEAGEQRQLLLFLNRKLPVMLITLITRAGVLAVKEVLISERSFNVAGNSR